MGAKPVGPFGKDGASTSDGVLEGSWGAWAIEVKTGRFRASELAGLLELVRRHPRLRPLVICSQEGRAEADRAGVERVTWQEFLLEGPPSPGRAPRRRA